MPRPKTAALIAADPERGVRITSPGLEDTPERETILRGSLAVESLPLLKVDHTYQRELLRPSTNRDIQRAIDMGVDLPDLTLGMRGDRVHHGHNRRDRPARPGVHHRWPAAAT